MSHVATKYKVYFMDCSNGVTKAFKLIDGMGKRKNIPVKKAELDIKNGTAELIDTPWWV